MRPGGCEWCVGESGVCAKRRSRRFKVQREWYGPGIGGSGGCEQVVAEHRLLTVQIGGARIVGV